jgi:type II secretory pathway pseudopilin PulG
MRERRTSDGFRISKPWVFLGILMLGGILVVLVVGLRKAKEGSRIQRAQNEIRDLLSAIEQYQSTYGMPPVSEQAKNSVTAQCPDFTFGTVNQSPGGRDPFLTDDKGGFLFPIANKGNKGYQNSNAEIIGILLDLIQFANGNPTVNVNHAKNPEHTVFLKARQANDTVSPGIGTDGVYRDPWGNPYIITLDMNGDGRCRDAQYRIQVVSSQRGGATGHNKLRNYVDRGGFTSDFEAEASIMIWSFGPDGKVDQNPADRAPNKDNILSWN